MSRPFQLLPDQASTFASHTDTFFYFLCAISVVVGTGVVATLLYFSLRYRRVTVDRPPLAGQSLDHEQIRRLEILWIAIPMAIFLGIFYWGATLYAGIVEAPPDALTVYVVAKRWMWKTQHLGGQREINELHVPVGQPVRLMMTSEDVIHSFYVPAFRVKQDVLPGRYSTMWFEPTKVGEYHLFCAEYCGTKHSGMIGRVVVMEPAAYQAWLGGGQTGSLAQAGEKRFNDLGCTTCHRDDAQARAPQLHGLFGSQVTLRNGETVLADEGYLRESILDPKAKVVQGFEPIMPTYTTQLDEVGVLELIAYIKSLEGRSGPAHGAAAGAAATAAAPAASAAVDGGEPSHAEPASAGETPDAGARSHRDAGAKP